MLEAEGLGDPILSTRDDKSNTRLRAIQFFDWHWDVLVLFEFK
jgi:hypothetical protein